MFPSITRSPSRSIAAFHRLHQQRYGFCDASRPVEIVNLRLRMIAAGDPYAPAYRDPVPGDGSAACYARAPGILRRAFLPTHLYRREGTRSWAMRFTGLR